MKTRHALVIATWLVPAVMSAWADKFVNTGPGTIHTCDTLSRVIIGAPVDETTGGMQLTLGNSTEFSSLGGSMEIMGAKSSGGLNVFMYADNGGSGPTLETWIGASAPNLMIAGWYHTNQIFYTPYSVETPAVATWNLHAGGEIHADGEIQSATGFRSTGPAFNVPDFVFEPDYKLRSLEETERFVKANRHLPEIPSAEEIRKDGMNLTEMNLKLLQKVEELTLHAIEQEKRIKALESRIATH